MYNLFQFVGYIYIFVIFLIHYFKEGPGNLISFRFFFQLSFFLFNFPETIQTIYPSLRNPIKFLNLMQLLEVVHPLIGYTSGSALIPFTQLCGRFFFIFLLIDRQIEVQSHYATFYVLLVYTVSEILRYWNNDGDLQITFFFGLDTLTICSTFTK